MKQKDVVELYLDDILVVKSKNCKKMLVFTVDATETNGLNVRKLTKNQLNTALQTVDLNNLPQIYSKYVFKGKDVWVFVKDHCEGFCVAEVRVEDEYKYEVTTIKHKEYEKEQEESSEMLM